MGLVLYQKYRLVEIDDPERGPWKASTVAYFYRVEDGEGGELASWHWHPHIERAPRPHAHVAGPLASMHLPTSRVSIEDVLGFVITELEAVPQRTDWRDVLDTARQAFEQWRSWP